MLLTTRCICQSSKAVSAASPRRPVILDYTPVVCGIVAQLVTSTLTKFIEVNDLMN